ncbi:DJ-1/PfpI family protein [Arenimonas terrae]|uniref:Type 1 glutamine amidotransferase domain-containing protein n=1 Tax=Arenimonas terrae TaxID=2546226 RepID=A0A5C4RTJ4_9GAMM|nr:DJ-1/PfpI family protein [Arenimonas terrae]TNJ34285.1 type 1 glutamine amidotransferase domain-containing protein [Arenimonas terrae]
MRTILPGLLLATLMISTPAVAADAGTTRALIVVSSEGRDAGKTRPGFEMDEFAQTWLILRANGVVVDVASPAGGAVQADRFDPKEPFNAAVVADAEAQRQLGATRRTDAVKADDYDAVLVMGGKGAMFDLADDAALHRLLGQVYADGGVVAAVCHGPAALVDAKLPDGTALVAGRALTGFSLEEESVFGKKWATQFRFQLETALRDGGALWQEAALMLPKVVVDGRLVTGQNPYSTAGMAEAVVRALGRTPVARTPWRDELTMALAQQALAGDADGARQALAAEPARYHAALIGMLGYYQLQSAPNDSGVRDALLLMQLARPHMSEPQLPLGIAEAQWRLGQTAAARETLAALLAKHPDLKQARDLQARLTP